MNPGWYPDPYAPAGLRWWDGTQWTSHTAPVGPTQSQGWAPPPSAAADLDGERSAGRRASIALPLGAALAIADLFFIAFVFGHEFHETLDRIREQMRAADQGRTVSGSVQFGSGGDGLWDLVWLPTLAVLIFFMIWLYRAATIAARAGVPAKRKRVWAVLGFIIPIVNFWFPYQVARDAFPWGDPNRRIAARWWGWYLGQTFVTFPVLILAIFSVPAAVVAAAVGSIVPVMAAREGRALIAAIDGAHHKMLML